MKRLLLLIFFLGTTLGATSQTLHAILVSDVEDPRLGGISLSDEKKILQILKTAEWGTGLTLKKYYHNRRSFTAKAVRQTLRQMRVGARDVVFFYYTGQGYYPGRNDKFPTFKLKENALRPLLFFMNNNPPLSLNEVGDLLQARGARLNVVMADCRDTAEKLILTFPGTIFDEDTRKVFLKKLFLGSCGLVKVASAERGKKVWANRDGGGAGESVYTENFSSTFSNLLESKFYGVRQATWPQVLKLCESNYINIGESSRRATIQKAVYEVKACSASQRRRTTRYATYRYSLTAGEIGKMLDNYLKMSRDFEKLSDEISRAFRRNAKINLIQKNKYPASDSRAISMTQRMNVADFLKQFEGSSDRIKSVYTDIASVKRTLNKEYLTGLTITEVFDEM